MRVSGDSKRPDFKPEMLGALVCLDGCEVTNVLHADDEAGEITVAVMNERGNVGHTNGAIHTKVLRGHVRIYPRTMAEACKAREATASNEQFR